MGGESGERFTWSSCLGWRGRLEAEEGNLFIMTNFPGLVLDLGPGKGPPSAGPTVFRILKEKFRAMSTVYYCKRVCFPPEKVVFYTPPGSGRVGSTEDRRCGQNLIRKAGSGAGLT